MAWRVRSQAASGSYPSELATHSAAVRRATVLARSWFMGLNRMPRISPINPGSRPTRGPRKTWSVAQSLTGVLSHTRGGRPRISPSARASATVRVGEMTWGPVQNTSTVGGRPDRVSR